MKKLLLISILMTWCLVASGVNAFALTTVADQFPVGPSGAPWYSSLVVSWPAYTTTVGQAVGAGSQTVAVAANGSFTVQLTPTDSETPQFQYTVQYVGQGSTLGTTVQWTVPTSSYPLTLQQVQSAVQVNGRTSLMLSQLRCPDCANGDLPAFNGAQFQAVNVSAFDAAGAAKTHAGHVCVEDYLTSAMNGDYGKAINAAVQAASFAMQTQVSICSQGDHPLGTQVVFDRPISFWMHNSRLVLQSSLQSTPVTITGASLTAGNKTVTVPSTSNLKIGMAIGGIGVTATSYIQSILNGTTFTLSLPAGIMVNGYITSGSATLSNVSSLRGITTGQTVTAYGIPSGTTITGINYANQAITLSNAATVTISFPSSLAIGGTWTANLKAVAATPAIAWVYNPNSMQNSEGQDIGGEMHGVWITDPGFRILTGVQGVQINGWDRFTSDHLQVENLQGSPLILGGYAPSAGVHGIVRESYFHDTELRDSGDGLTGQSCVELMTGYNSAISNSDEHNQIAFSGGQCVFNYGEGLTIGTFNPAHTSINGPRLIWLTDNFQIEGGSHVPNQNIVSPYDIIHILQAQDIYVEGAEIAAPGYGKSVVRVDAGVGLSVLNSRIYTPGKFIIYNINVTHGSPIVTWAAGGNSGFDGSGYWDGIGAQINEGGTCQPCNVYLLPSGAVSAGGTTLTLASNYVGATGSAIMAVGAGGYMFNVTSPSALAKLTALGNVYNDADSLTMSLLGLPAPANGWNVGGGFFGNPPAGMNDHSGALASSFLTVGSGSTVNAINYLQTASITPAAVLGQTCSDQTFSVPGVATASDHLYLSNTPAAVGNISVAATASGANTVSLHFCNPTAGSITPPPGIYTFVDLR
ncbi:MAG TPA: hypothetical protein VH351_08580 [Bryobacteraceae bacterium]|jgi:hypothetical protein|nr:hypothetical protein [Bryobacteraceae bacterium]